MLKATMAASQVVLKQYEWVETTVVSLKGDEKSRKQERCYYGADGGVQKVLLTQSAPPPKKRGFFRRKIAESKQEELTDYMKSAVSQMRFTALFLLGDHTAVGPACDWIRARDMASASRFLSRRKEGQFEFGRFRAHAFAIARQRFARENAGR